MYINSIYKNYKSKYYSILLFVCGYKNLEEYSLQYDCHDLVWR